LGFINYHRDFLPDLANILAPLQDLNRKDLPFQWSSHCDQAFQLLKEVIAGAPVLAYPNTHDTYVLDTDASDVAIAGALYQLQDGVERPISFASLTLTPQQRKYCTTRKELLAVVAFTRRFRHYLLGQRFKVRTDHGSLTWLCNFKNPCGQLGRWLEELAQYDMQIEHRPGSKHINADSLSRIPEVSPECPHYDPDTDLSSLPCGGCSYCARLHSQWSRFNSDVDFVSPFLVRSVSNEDKDDPQESDGSDSNYIPQMSATTWRELQLADPELQPILWWLDGPDPTPEELFSEGFSTKMLWRHRQQLKLIKGVLHYERVSADTSIDCLVVPLSEREEAIRMLHDSHVGGHWGRDKTLHKLSQRLYWPTMNRDVAIYIATCLVCCRNKYQHKQHGALCTYQAGYPGERVHLDFLGPFTTSSRGNRHILSMVDQFTKWIELVPLPEQSAESTCKALVENWIARFGAPRIIHTDQGKNFDSKLFRCLCEALEISKTRTTPYHPRSNGQVERYNQQIASYIRCFLEGKIEDWDQYLPLLGMSLRATVSRSTGYTPNMLCLGREVNLPLDVLLGTNVQESVEPSDYARTMVTKMTQVFNSARNHLKSSQVRSKRYYDDKISRPQRHFEPGDLVMVTNSATAVGHSKKLQPLWKGPIW
jgi:transposase InsO family protein